MRIPSVVAACLVCTACMASAPRVQPAPENVQQPGVTAQPALPDTIEFERISSLDDEPIRFSLDDIRGGFVERAIAPASGEIELLIEASERGDKCGLPFRGEHAMALRAAFAEGQMRLYRIRTPELVAGDHVGMLLVLPNAMGYQDIDALRDDFDVCAAGAWKAFKVTRSTIVFTLGCGGASDNETLCDSAEHAIKTTLTIR